MKRFGWLGSLRLWMMFAVLALSGASGVLRSQADDTKPTEKPATEKADKAAEDKKRDAEYYELLKLFADTLDQVDRNYVKDVSRRELMEAAIRGMMSKLDQYSNYIPPEEIEQFKGSVESEFGGIGIQVSIEGGQLQIISPIVGSPAYKAGLLAGDKIMQIEGKTTKGITLEGAVKQMKGKVGTEVKVTVEHPADGKTETVTLKREIVRVDTVMGDRRNDKDAWDYIYDKEKKIGYIRINSFSRHTTDELSAALKTLSEQEMKALVVDLRFNPGGLLSSAIEVSDLFISKGRIVSTAGRNTTERVWDAKEAGTFAGFPMAILVNKYSASASEIVSACLQDHQRAVVIGERTWGKGSVQNIINLEDGKSALKLTTAGYLRPSGKNIHRADSAGPDEEWGVKPNDGFEVKNNDAENSAYLRYRRDRDILKKEAKEPTEPKDGDPAPFVDKQLQSALDYLTKQLAEKPAEKDADKAEAAKKLEPKAEG